MHFSVTKKSLLSALTCLYPIVEKRNVMPILSHLKLELKDKVLMLSATDMDIHIDTHLSVLEGVDCAFTLPAHPLFELIKRLPDDTVIHLASDARADTSIMHITCGSVKCSLPFLSASEFPQFTQDSDNLCTFTLKSELLSMLLNEVRYAVSLDEGRYYLNGVYLHITSGHDNKYFLKLASTDGHRLAKAQIAMQKEEVANMPGILVPRKTVNELVRLMEASDERVSLSISRNKITVKLGNVSISSKLIDAIFPDYDKVIPKNNEKILEINNKELKNAVALVTSVAHDKVKTVNFILSKNKLLLVTNSVAGGGAQAQQEIHASYSAEPMKISFNSRYISDVLSIVKGEKSKIFLSSSSTAALIQGDDSDFSLHLIMPTEI